MFSLPLLFWVHENTDRVDENSVLSGYEQFIGLAREILGNRNLLIFLAAYWLYIDGVYTIIKMAVDYGLALGLSMQNLIQAILVTNLIGFPAAIGFGRLGRAIGAKRGLFIGIGVYFVITIAAVFMTREWEFYVLAACIGLVQGGVQSLSRSLYAHLVPAGHSAAYFGFYNMLGQVFGRARPDHDRFYRAGFSESALRNSVDHPAVRLRVRCCCRASTRDPAAASD